MGRPLPSAVECSMHNSIKNQSVKIWPLVPCAGIGSRSGAVLPKQYVRLAGQSVVAHTLSALAAVNGLETVTVVIAPQDYAFRTHCPGFTSDVAMVGGASRALTVRAGLKVLREKGAKDGDWVLVHDAARCLVEAQSVFSLIERCKEDTVGGLLACKVADTLKQARDCRSIATVPREDKWLAQTPQMFRMELLERALDYAEKVQIVVTDEASAIEVLGKAPLLIESSADNFKLTYPNDFKRAEMILRLRQEAKVKDDDKSG